MMEPPLSGMRGTTPRTSWVTLVKFSRTRASSPLGLMSMKAEKNPPPALFTSTSTRPNSSLTCSRKRCTASASRTSSTSHTIRRPIPSIARAVAARFS